MLHEIKEFIKYIDVDIRKLFGYKYIINLRNNKVHDINNINCVDSITKYKLLTDEGYIKYLGQHDIQLCKLCFNNTNN